MSINIPIQIAKGGEWLWGVERNSVCYKDKGERKISLINNNASLYGMPMNKEK